MQGLCLGGSHRTQSRSKHQVTR